MLYSKHIDQLSIHNQNYNNSNIALCCNMLKNISNCKKLIKVITTISNNSILVDIKRRLELCFLSQNNVTLNI